MKKSLVIVIALMLVGAFSLPAMALDNEFGGYWRTRFYNNTDFSGNDSGSQDLQQVDTRTRLYYTAILSDEVKLVNQFEMDAVWGDTERGDIGADGQNFEIKRSYADINLGDWNVKMGTQGKTFARGFLFDDDFTGLIVRYMGDDMLIPFIWMKAYEGGSGKDANDMDFDYYGVDPTFTMGDIKLNPFVLYMTSAGGGEVNAGNEWTGWDNVTGLDAVSVYYLGVNVDYNSDKFSAWLTAIYSAGTVDVEKDTYEAIMGTDSFDVAAYLFAVGGSMNLDKLSIHAQFFYATGDEDGLDDDEASDFFVPAGQSYYWSEIMGMGVFDYQASAGSPGDAISNIMAFNVGVEFPLEKLTLGLDVWNASLVEEDANGETALGTEIDVTANYQLLEDLKVTAVAAYLAAGEATGGGDENPVEVGVQFTLSF